MQTTITINCPHCHTTRITKNGKKRNATQNYRCKDDGRQFIAEHERSYNGTILSIAIEILFPLAPKQTH
jgi:transposase-like protein